MAIDVTGMSDAGFDYQPSVVAPSVWESALGIETASRLELIARVEAGLNASSLSSLVPFQVFQERI